LAPAGPPPGSPLRRSERAAILAAIGGVTALAWLYLVAMAAGMERMHAPETAELLALRRWTARDFVLMLLMWVVMMIGMMLPSATPMTLIYAQVARKARREGTILAPTGVFVAGYLLAWSFFSLFATLAQWGLDRAALLSPMMVSRSPQLGAALLIGAGVYQLTPLKNACLRHCRDPARFFARSWRPGTLGALRLGWVHGVFCLGCCWVLMGLLFVGGVMNLLWIAAITLFVLLETVVPLGVAGGRAAGIALIGLGFGLLLGLR
jgi:predicted metal-binding membrane protein